MPLTPKQERFVAEYVIDLNATRAAVRAGYSAKTANEQAARLLAKVSVAAAVAEAARKHTIRAEITAQDVLDGLRTEATRTGEGSSHGARVTAWGLLGKYHQLFIDRVEVTVTHKLADLSDDDLVMEIKRVASGEEPAAITH